MILYRRIISEMCMSKPRASGDDPLKNETFNCTLT